MSQWDIYGFLKRNKEGWFTAKQLAEQLGASSGSVASCVRRLRKADLVACKTVKWARPGMTNQKDIFAYRFREA